jgi:hypothetical protein
MLGKISEVDVEEEETIEQRRVTSMNSKVVRCRGYGLVDARTVANPTDTVSLNRRNHCWNTPGQYREHRRLSAAQPSAHPYNGRSERQREVCLQQWSQMSMVTRAEYLCIATVRQSNPHHIGLIACRIGDSLFRSQFPSPSLVSRHLVLVKLIDYQQVQ